MASSIINSDDGAISGTSGLKTTGGNDGSLKIQANGVDAISIADDGTVSLAAGALPAASGGTGLTDPGTAGNVLTSNGSAWVSTAPAGGSANIQTFDTSGTWTKPSSGSIARVQMWGAGGGGAKNISTGVAGGGGGGGYNELTVPLSYLDSSVSVTVGAGGAGRTGSQGVGTAGGTTSVPFANYEGSARTFYAYGGAGGSNIPDTIAGGGGLLGAGASGASGTQLTGSPWTIVGSGAHPYEKIWAGGTGAGSGATTSVAFLVVFGGNGGAGASSSANTTGGTPVYGGKGGDGGRVTSGFDGTAPAGGGGGRNNNANGGNGAAGRVIVTVW